MSFEVRWRRWIGCLTLSLVVFGCGADGAPTRLPELTSAAALPGGDVVPATAWLGLDFAADVGIGVTDVFQLDCGTATPAIDVDVVTERTLVINPRAELPGGAICTLTWPGPNDEVSLTFSVAAAATPAIATYDRNTSANLAPFPDDHFRVADNTAAAGYRLDIPVPDHTADVQAVISSFTTMIDSDGFSPLTTIVVPLPAAPSEGSVPLTTEQSVDPFATVGLFDVDPNSASYGQRMPFFASLRAERNPDGSNAHHLLMFPARPLRSLGAYAVVVLRRAIVDDQRPLSPSAYSRRVLGLDGPESAAEVRGHSVLAPVVEMLGEHASPPIRPDDIALALRFTVRDTSGFARDRLAIRERTLALPAPSFVIDSVFESSNPDIAAVVVGTWQAPVWTDGHFLLRDSDGLPMTAGTRDVEFRMTIPKSAVAAPVPITFYQHGTPASLGREIAWAGASLVGGGAQEFAVIGFTDLLNRETEGIMLSAALYQDIVDQGSFPDIVYTTTFAEQLSFIRLIKSLGSVDVLPRGAPDGVPDLDVSAPLTYLGVSHGSINGVGLLPYAPEIRAAALVAGGGNYAGILAHQSEFVLDITFSEYPALTRSELYVTFPLMQIPFDAQDPLNHAPFMYDSPHELGTPARASILMSEGVGDSFVPAWSTQSAAAGLGIPLLAPAPLSASFLDSAEGTVAGNINASTTAALSQYVPIGVAGMSPTPGCADNNQDEGHFCPQSAVEAFAQRRQFFISALSAAPPVIETYTSYSQRRVSPPQQPFVPIVTSASHDWRNQKRR